MRGMYVCVCMSEGVVGGDIERCMYMLVMVCLSSGRPYIHTSSCWRVNFGISSPSTPRALGNPCSPSVSSLFSCFFCETRAYNRDVDVGLLKKVGDDDDGDV